MPWRTPAASATSGRWAGALRSGADNPQVVVEESSDGLDTFRVHAKAMGKPRLARWKNA